MLRRNEDDMECPSLWLADDYNNLPDYHPYLPSPEGTRRPLNPNWQSPFRGKTVAEAADFLRSVPKPPKPLCKTYFAVYNKALYREQDHIVVCRILEDGQVQSIPCRAACLSRYFALHDPDLDAWEQCLTSWEEDGRVLR